MLLEIKIFLVREIQHRFKRIKLKTVILCMYMHKGRNLSQIHYFNDSLIEVQFTYLKCAVHACWSIYHYANVLHDVTIVNCPAAVALSPPPLLQPCITLHLVSLYAELPVLDFPCGWNHAVYGLL